MDVRKYMYDVCAIYLNKILSLFSSTATTLLPPLHVNCPRYFSSLLFSILSKMQYFPLPLFSILPLLPQRKNSSLQKHGFTFCTYYAILTWAYSWRNTSGNEIVIQREFREREGGVCHPHRMYVYNFWVRRYLWHWILSNFRDIFPSWIHFGALTKPHPPHFNPSIHYYFIS